MIDLFGMGKKEDPAGEPHPETAAPASSAAPADEARAPKGSHRLWAFLLVVDSVFVIVFGGAVAAKIYQYARQPALAAPAPVRRRPAPKSADSAPTPSTAAAPAPAPKPAETAKPPEPPKPAPKPETKTAAKASDSPRPPKPSLITEPPKPHAAPALAGAAAASATAPSASSADPKKALPVVFKLSAANASSVQLVGAFIVHGGRKDMTKGEDGTWTVKLYLNPGQYRYFFAVDKKKTLDPENPRSDRGASVVSVP